MYGKGVHDAFMQLNVLNSGAAGLSNDNTFLRTGYASLRVGSLRDSDPGYLDDEIWPMLRYGLVCIRYFSDKVRIVDVF